METFEFLGFGVDAWITIITILAMYDDVNKEKHYLRTAYITFGSSLIGTTMGTNGFEKEHKLTLVAVSHRGSRIEESPRSVVLKSARLPTCLSMIPEDTGLAISCG